MSITDRLDGYDGRDIEEVLYTYDAYIRALAYQMAPGVSADARRLEIDEIAQNTRVKLFLALSKPDHKVTNIKAYIGKIAYHESINIIRRNPHHEPLKLDVYGEVEQGEILIAPSQGMQDPAWEIECQEEIEECAEALVRDIYALPARQRYAVICALREMISDVQPLEEAFLKIGLNFDSLHCSDEAKEIQRLRALLYIARKKLRVVHRERESVVEGNA